MFKIMTGDMAFSKHRTLEEAKEEMAKRKEDRDRDVAALMDQIDEVELFFSDLRIVHGEDETV